jgi:hypothetical protein
MAGRSGLRKLLGLGVTAAMTYFLDSEHGAARRADAMQRASSLLRRGQGAAEDKAGSAVAKAHGLAERVAHPQMTQAPIEDDATLTDKVETEIFRDAEVPKGQIVVNTERGRVVLRGEVPSEDMRSRLEAEARKVPGVTDVENLLHTPGTPVPTSTPRDPEEVKAELREPSPSTGYGQSASSGEAGGEPKGA